jgi:hypothetical protein
MSLNNFEQPLSSKPFLNIQILGHSKVVGDSNPNDPYVVFVIQAETNIKEYKTDQRSSEGNYLWYILYIYSFSP